MGEAGEVGEVRGREGEGEGVGRGRGRGRGTGRNAGAHGRSMGKTLGEEELHEVIRFMDADGNGLRPAPRRH